MRGIEKGAMLLSALCLACGGDSPPDEPFPTVASIAADEDETTDGDAGTTGSDTSSDSTGDAGTTASVDDGSEGDGPILDVGVPGTDTGECDASDICCLGPGEIPPHALLDAFLAAYPDNLMPKSVAEVQAFEPMADGHAMAWSDENVGGELVDASNGGVIEANIEAGRALSREAAELTIPGDAIELDVREDPVTIEDLGGGGVCIGVGWAWGSILFQAADRSINEVVYLYIGYCADGDVEVFYYSDQAAQICEPPS